MVSPGGRSRATATSVFDAANEALDRIEGILPTQALRERYRTWRRDLAWIRRDLIGGQRPIIVPREDVDERTARRPLTVREIEAIDSNLFAVQLVEEDGSLLDHEAGQLLTLELEVDGRSLRGGFPLCHGLLGEVSAIVIDPKSNELAPPMHEALREGRLGPGDEIIGAGPSGVFVAPPHGEVERLVMIASGFGIVPTFCVAEAVLRGHAGTLITMLHCAADESERFFVDRVRALLDEYPERLHVELVLDDASDAVSAVLDGLKQRVEAKRYYLNGAPEIMGGVREVLREHGIRGSSIVQERFPRPSDDPGESHAERGKASGDGVAHAVSALLPARDPRALATVGASAIRGRILRRGKQGVPTKMPASHNSYFDWSYPTDHPELVALYQRAKRSQWDADDLPWHIEVDPYDPQVPLISDEFLDFAAIERITGARIAPGKRLRHRHDVLSWMMSQYLHGEQAALVASAQIAETVAFFEGKLFGATQVMDEGRHVEVLHRYVDEKLEKLYQIDDNLFVLIDTLMHEGRWDVKFLGTQILVKGIGLAAFTILRDDTSEPLLTKLLERVIADEERHLEYGVVALGEHIVPELSESERREREDWAFEIAVLMRDRFLGYEVFEESFEGLMSRAQWRQLIRESAGMERFRRSLFSRWGPNLRAIGLLTSRIEPHYAQAGLKAYFPS